MWSLWRKRFAQRFKKRELEFRGILTAKVNEAKKFDPALYVKVNCLFKKLTVYNECPRTRRPKLKLV